MNWYDYFNLHDSKQFPALILHLCEYLVTNHFSDDHVRDHVCDHARDHDHDDDDHDCDGDVCENFHVYDPKHNFLNIFMQNTNLYK